MNYDFIIKTFNFKRCEVVRFNDLYNYYYLKTNKVYYRLDTLTIGGNESYRLYKYKLFILNLLIFKYEKIYDKEFLFHKNNSDDFYTEFSKELRKTKLKKFI